MQKVLRPAIPVKCLIRAVQTNDQEFSLKELQSEIGKISLSEDHAYAVFSMGGKRRKFKASSAQACVDTVAWFQKGEKAIYDTRMELENVKNNGLSISERYLVSQRFSYLDDDLKKLAVENFVQQHVRNLESKLACIVQGYSLALECIDGN